MLGAAHLAGERPLGVELGAADQRLGKAVWVLGVVPAVAPLHTQPALVHRAGAPLGPENVVVPDVVGQGTAHPAVWADAVHRLALVPRHQGQREGLVGQRPGRADGSTLAARDAGTFSHRLVQVEADGGAVALAGAANHVIGLDFITGPETAIAQDAGG